MPKIKAQVFSVSPNFPMNNESSRQSNFDLARGSLGGSETMPIPIYESGGLSITTKYEKFIQDIILLEDYNDVTKIIRKLEFIFGKKLNLINVTA